MNLNQTVLQKPKSVGFFYFNFFKRNVETKNVCPIAYNNGLRLCVRFFALSECSILAQCSKAKTDAKPLLCVCVAVICHKTQIGTRKEKFKIAKRWQKKI